MHALHAPPSWRRAIVALGLAMLSASVAWGHEEKAGKPETPVLATAEGTASYYGVRFHGRKTANGEIMDRNAMTAAHPKWPFDTLVRVVNLKNERAATVRINDRGPARRIQRRGVIIDVSVAAAKKLDFIERGKVPVRLEVLRWGGKK